MGKIIKTKHVSRVTKKRVIIAIVLLLLVGAAVAGFLIWKQNSGGDGANNGNSDNVISQNGSGTQVLGPPKTVLDQQIDQIAYDAESTSSPEAKQQALAQYDALMPQATSEQQQADVLLAKASFALDAGLYDEALAAAREAEAIEPTAASSQMIANIAAEQGNKPLAIQYYKETINRYDKNAPMYESDVQYMRDQITELGGTV